MTAKPSAPGVSLPDDIRQARSILGVFTRKGREVPLLLLLLGALWLALDRLRSGVQTSAPADNWRASDAATEAKARELGMWPARRGESMQNFRDRIAMALKDRGQA